MASVKIIWQYYNIGIVGLVGPPMRALAPAAAEQVQAHWLEGGQALLDHSQVNTPRPRAAMNKSITWRMQVLN